MTLKQLGECPLFLHVGPRTKMIQVPAEGYTRLGNVTLYQLNDAYLYNLTARIRGFPFALSINGTSYTVFHVNEVNILQATDLPLYAVQTMDVVSGNYHECLGGDEREYFPLEFRLGFDEYGGHYGNIERFYHSTSMRATPSCSVSTPPSQSSSGSTETVETTTAPWDSAWETRTITTSGNRR